MKDTYKEERSSSEVATSQKARKGKKEGWRTGKSRTGVVER